MRWAGLPVAEPPPTELASDPLSTVRRLVGQGYGRREARQRPGPSHQPTNIHTEGYPAEMWEGMLEGYLGGAKN